jgi:hypothetical protein
MLSVDAFSGQAKLSLIITGTSMEVEPVVIDLDSGARASVQSTEVHANPWAASWGWGDPPPPRGPRDNAWLAVLPALPPAATEAHLEIEVDGRRHRLTVRVPQPEPEPAPVKRRGRTRKAA